MTLPVKRGKFRATCPNCPLDVTCTTAGLANKSMRMHSCERQHRLADMAARITARKADTGIKRECHHKYANHQHGTRLAYVLDRCRCLPCREDSSKYNSNLNRQTAYGRSNWTSAQPVREHIQMLQASGLGLKRIAKLSGVDHSNIARVIWGRTERNEGPAKQISKVNAAKILAVQASLQNLSDGAIVPDGGPGTWRRLQALVAIGWSQSRLAQELGILPSNIGHIIHGRTTPTAATVRAVHDLYDREWGHVQEGHDHRSKISVSRARNYAAKHGWVSPLAWDDDTIDNPAAVPFIEPEHVKGSTTREETFARKASERIEDIEFLKEGGVPAHEIAARLGLAPNKTGLKTLAQQMHRHGRDDLANYFERATRKNTRETADYTGRTK